MYVHTYIHVVVHTPALDGGGLWLSSGARTDRMEREPALLHVDVARNPLPGYSYVCNMFSR